MLIRAPAQSLKLNGTEWRPEAAAVQLRRWPIMESNKEQHEAMHCRDLAQSKKRGRPLARRPRFHAPHNQRQTLQEARSKVTSSAASPPAFVLEPCPSDVRALVPPHFHFIFCWRCRRTLPNPQRSVSQRRTPRLSLRNVRLEGRWETRAPPKQWSIR